MRTFRQIAVVLALLTAASAQAGQWTTHFAYNNVTQIALAEDKAFALSDGSLFSVDYSEKIETYNRQSGLHSTGIKCIHYDKTGKQLIICYGTGQIDILSSRGVQYISALYDKDMTQRKDIYNVTIVGRTAYLATHYGVQTMDLRFNTMVDSYWLRPDGQETPINDVLIANDSIYAFATDSLYCASLHDNLVDYTQWKREKRSSRVKPDANKGKQYQDATSTWTAGGAEGIVRQTAAERNTYKPDGPLTNTPYRMTATKGQLWVVQGGRWGAQFNKPGIIMHYDGTHWNNIEQSTIKAKTGNPTLDFMNVAVDPRNVNHYFVTSYGTGLYEFDHDTLVQQYLPGEGNSLIAVVPAAYKTYTRLDCASFDQENNLWMLDATENYGAQLHCLDTSKSWHRYDLVYKNTILPFMTPSALVIDKNAPNHKWMSTTRGGTIICLLDDKGTPFDTSDDGIISRNSWHDQNGRDFIPSFILDMKQDSYGRIWIGTDLGAAYISPSSDYFTSDVMIRPKIVDNNGENPITSLRVVAICEDAHNQIWIGTETLGVYVLSPDADEIVAHYTTENSTMPSNTILSIACDESGVIYIGTSEGLACYDGEEVPTEGSRGNNEDDNLDMGYMQQWKLHFSYNDPKEIVASFNRIYAVANGALFSVDRADETLEYWNKSTGLHGTFVSHIAYDPKSKQLVIAYDDGRIDLMDDKGNVIQMPDLYMKAGAVSVSINCLHTGSRYVYAGTSFGIIAINTQKAEIADTYYIGPEAAYVNVQQIVELKDTLFAFSYDKVYKISLRDNLMDYTFWRSDSLPCEQVQQACVWKDELYTLQHDSLYRLTGKNNWQLVRPEAIQWIHSHDGQLLIYIANTGLFRLSEDGQLIGLNNIYPLNNAIYTQGEYWLAETGSGLIRLNTNSDDYFHTDGPNNNFGYQMTTAHGQIYAVNGGRWAAQFQRYGRINIYDGQAWKGITEWAIGSKVGQPAMDIVSIAVDPSDAGHFFAATYGTGVYEFRNYEAVVHYTPDNSTLREATMGIDKQYYTRTDGALMDDKGNFWVLNATAEGQPVHVMTSNGQWYGLPILLSGKNVHLTTPTGLMLDRRNSQRKWFLDQRGVSGVFLMDDGGTPTISSDDRFMVRSAFVDQNNNTITPTYFRCIAQDKTNRLWIGTDKGIITIPSSVDFFTSNACRRIIIPRNDGTGLGDYLLGDEQINCLAVDGGNRIWIGTANSGLYLIEDDTITVAHFTENNSLLPSNSIQSIAIIPTTGEVFVGTDKGIASYKSDASEPQETMSGVYAYPNPVRPNYGGYISITGLMDNTVVNIVDAGGNLVCKTRSHGGTAVWDGKLYDGRRATPGVYTALCNANGGHTVVKILVAR